MRVKEKLVQKCDTALKIAIIAKIYVNITWFLFVFANRSGLVKSEVQLAECTGWRDISNSTGHKPVERIMIDAEHAQKVNNSS